MTNPMEVLEPFGKNMIVSHAFSELFEPEKKAQRRKLELLIVENQAMGGTMGAFRFEGILITLQSTKAFRGQEVLCLRKELEPAYRLIQKAEKNLSQDILRIKQALSMVVPKCRNLQDLRDNLPEAMVSKIPSLSSIPRINEEGFSLNDRPHLIDQFRKASDLVFRYQANRLFD